MSRMSQEELKSIIYPDKIENRMKEGNFWLRHEDSKAGNNTYQNENYYLDSVLSIDTTFTGSIIVDFFHRVYEYTYRYAGSPPPFEETHDTTYSWYSTDTFLIENHEDSLMHLLKSKAYLFDTTGQLVSSVASIEYDSTIWLAPSFEIVYNGTDSCNRSSISYFEKYLSPLSGGNSRSYISLGDLGEVYREYFNSTGSGSQNTIKWFLEYAYVNGCPYGNIQEYYNFYTLKNYSVFADDEIKIYPNPASSQIHIESKRDIEALDILNTLGQVVFNANDLMKSQDLDLSFLSEGIYILRLKSSEDTWSSLLQIVK